MFPLLVYIYVLARPIFAVQLLGPVANPHALGVPLLLGRVVFTVWLLVAVRHDLRLWKETGIDAACVVVLARVLVAWLALLLVSLVLLGLRAIVGLS